MMGSYTMEPLTPEFTFAGFTWPRYVAMLPRGSFGKRIAAMRRPVCGPYYHAPKPNQREGSSFYLASDFMPGLRWQWCDEVVPIIGHTGWFTDEYGDGEKVRGLVFRLPHGRGFLIGWSMGEGMCGEVSTSFIYPNAHIAAHAANNWADKVAERQWEHEEAAA